MNPTTSPCDPHSTESSTSHSARYAIPLLDYSVSDRLRIRYIISSRLEAASSHLPHLPHSQFICRCATLPCLPVSVRALVPNGLVKLWLAGVVRVFGRCVAEASCIPLPCLVQGFGHWGYRNRLHMPLCSNISNQHFVNSSLAIEYDQRRFAPHRCMPKVAAFTCPLLVLPTANRQHLRHTVSWYLL